MTTDDITLPISVNARKTYVCLLLSLTSSSLLSKCTQPKDYTTPPTRASHQLINMVDPIRCDVSVQFTAELQATTDSTKGPVPVVENVAGIKFSLLPVEEADSLVFVLGRNFSDTLLTVSVLSVIGH